jgi:hypothetical protein
MTRIEEAPAVASTAPAALNRPRHVVSISLGSSQRDERVATELLGQAFIIERIGTNGDYAEFCRRLREIDDGTVDAIGLGGINLALAAGRRRYPIRDAMRAVAGLRTPVVDGSGIKSSWERHILQTVVPGCVGGLRGRRALLVSSVDRFALAEALAEVGADAVYGDLMFGLGLPIPLRGLTTITVLAAVLLPILTRLPFRWLYPTGARQDAITPKFHRWYRWAEVICGDFHLIRRFMPDDLSGKVIFTNTVTREDAETLRARRVAWLITSTPNMQGRSFATNVLEAVVVTLSGKRPEQLSGGEYLQWMKRAGFAPRVERFADPSS